MRQLGVAAMSPISWFTQLRQTLLAFMPASTGNVAIIFGIAAIPVVGLVGAVVDYSRANLAKAAMLSALDSTALSVSMRAASLSSSELTAAATTTFTALFTRPEVTGVTVTPNYTTTDGSQLTVTARGSMQTSLLGLLGVSQVAIGGSSVVRWGMSRMRVALVLDNTGSMDSAGKMTALKTAAHNLLTQLKNAATKDGDVYVSIIPFNKDVNVGSANSGASWIRWDLYGNWFLGFWIPGNRNAWNGCVTDRDQDYDTTNTAPSAATATLFPADDYSECPQSLLGLTYDWTALNNKIDAMRPEGNTNQAIGLQIGFQSLTSAPFTIPPMDPDYQYQQVIILLTDGLNTENRWYSSAASIDARQRKTCDNVKAAGITLYTVQVNTASDPTSSLLQYCASDPGKFFLLTSASQIVTTFEKIGTAMSHLRIAK
jgi:Flp pilus assembly protein TadG